MFANTNVAFEDLTPGTQSLVGDLIGVYTPSLVHGSQGSLKKVAVHGEG